MSVKKKKKCRDKNKSGGACGAYAGESGFCYMHDTSKGKERALARRRGGFATKQPHFADASILPPNIRSISDAFIILDYALKEAVGLDNSINRNRLLVSIARGYFEGLKIGELEQRLEAVEMALSLRKENQK